MIFQDKFLKNQARLLPYIIIGDFMPAIKQRIEPQVCTYLDPEAYMLIVQVVLPGAEKDKICVKVKTDAILIRAESDEVDYCKYIFLSMRLKKALSKAIYENDILRITIPAQE
ncbi:MAG: Hsp20/alpha crystallin family protein [candidate division WOR-3 bacterium]